MEPKLRSLLLFLPALVLGFLSSPSAADNVLYAGDRLLSGQSLVQDNFSLVMQEDCNLVLYYGRRPLWASQTYDLWKTPCAAIMQRDGNFVVYGSTGKPLWASGTQRPLPGNYVLVLHPDGDVVIYGGSIWATGTRGGWGTGGAAPPTKAKFPAPAPPPAKY